MMRKLIRYSLVFSTFLIITPAAAQHDAERVNLAALEFICQNTSSMAFGEECFDRQYDAAEKLLELFGHVPYRRKRVLESCMADAEHLDFVKAVACYEERVSSF